MEQADDNTSSNRLEKELDEAEKEAIPGKQNACFELEQIAYILGAIPVIHRQGSYGVNRPRLEKLMAQMPSRDSLTKALLSCSSWMNRDDRVGRVAELLTKIYGNR